MQHWEGHVINRVPETCAVTCWVLHDQNFILGRCDWPEVCCWSHCVFFVQYASNVIITVDLTGFNNIKSLLRQRISEIIVHWFWAFYIIPSPNASASVINVKINNINTFNFFNIFFKISEFNSGIECKKSVGSAGFAVKCFISSVIIVCALHWKKINSELNLETFLKTETERVSYIKRKSPRLWIMPIQCEQEIKLWVAVTIWSK